MQLIIDYLRNSSKYSLIVVLVFGLLLSGCRSIPSPVERKNTASQLTADKQWHMFTVPAGDFELAVFKNRVLETTKYLTIYIEGDGFAWKTRTQPSKDPTPINPIGLRLAIQQPEGDAVYLARPCQYISGKKCTQRYWTNQRFAPEVIASMASAVESLKQRFSAERITLVGFSGGAAVAALVAAQRDDVDKLVTVAGNLDHRAWTKQLRLTPLTGSLNPVSVVDQLQGLEQWHFAGEKDKIIPPRLVKQFADRFNTKPYPVVRVEEGFSHHCCWAEEWPKLWRLQLGL